MRLSLPLQEVYSTGRQPPHSWCFQSSNTGSYCNWQLRDYIPWTFFTNRSRHSTCSCCQCRRPSAICGSSDHQCWDDPSRPRFPTDPGSLVDGFLSVEVDHLMSMYMSCALSEQSNPLLLVPLHTQNISLPVDLLDSLIGLYRCKLRSENWYHRIFLHMCDLTVVNAWLLYKRILRANASEGRMMCLHEFKYAIAEGLCYCGKTTTVWKVLKKRRSEEMTPVHCTCQALSCYSSSITCCHKRPGGTLSEVDWQTSALQASWLSEVIEHCVPQVWSEPMFLIQKWLLLYVPLLANIVQLVIGNSVVL